MESVDYKAKGDAYKLLGISNFVRQKYSSAEKCLNQAMFCYNKTQIRMRYAPYREEIKESVRICNIYISKVKQIKSRDMKVR